MATGSGSLRHSTPRSRNRGSRGSSSSAHSHGSEYVNGGTPEELLLENYFISLSKFKFDQARERCDRERDSKPRPTNWCDLMSALSRLAIVESSYFSVSSVERGGSKFRKSQKEHTLKNNYETIVLELKKVKEVYNLGKGGADFSWERKLAELLVHVIEYTSARKELFDFYVSFDYTDGCHLDYKKWEDYVKSVGDRFRGGFHHNLLKPLRSTFQKEINVVTDLLRAQQHMSEWEFLPAVLSVQSCEARLSSWHGVIPLDMAALDRRQVQRSIKSRPYAPSSVSSIPFLYKWWCKFHVMLISKFSLYFHQVLGEHASVYDMKYLSTKLDTDYIASFWYLIRNTSAACVCLIFDTNGLLNYKGPKYHLPDSPPLSLTGINSYPFMLQVPNDFNFLHHRPNIVSLIMEKSHQLNTSTQHVSQFDENLHCTYHMTQLEPRVTLVVLANTRGTKDRDSKITSWISDIAVQLRNTSVASLLRPH